MKRILISFFLISSICSFGQEKDFKDLKEFFEWTENYYKKPEPQYLFDAFLYGAKNGTFVKGGGLFCRGFFSSCLRSDALKQDEFFNKLKQTRETDVIYAFGLTLWYTNTSSALKNLKRFQDLDQVSPYNRDIDVVKEEKLPDLLKDPVTTFQHVELLWVDFCATGNEENIKKLIGCLDRPYSKTSLVNNVTNSASTKLWMGGIRHDKVLEICKRQSKIVTGEIKKNLDGVIKRIEDSRKKIQ